MSRRNFLGASASALAAAPLLGPTASLNRLLDAPRHNSLSAGLSSPIKRVVILCQENRTLDHYLGFLTQLGNPRPEHASQKVDAQGNTYEPYHLTDQCDFDPDHSWDGSHAKWDQGAMDGFVAVDDGAWPLGYYLESDHPYHVDLATAFSVSDQHFCPLIGPTTPNRNFLWTGTSGGWRQNPDPSSPTSLSAMNWPTVADSLDAKGVSWACYAVADGNTPTPIGAFNPYVFFLDTVAKDPRTFLDISAFLALAASNQLPAVSWIVTEAVVSEHPPAPPDLGQALVARVVQALMSNADTWASTALFVTYDEGGGFWDHVPPVVLERDVPADHPWVDTATTQTQFVNDGQPVGPGFRVPLMIVSAYVPQGTVIESPSDHTSILRFIEWCFGLDAIPTIAPQRRSQLTDLVSVFDFNSSPDTSSRDLPQVVDISAALETCAQTIPEWLPPLLGQTVTPFPEPAPASVPDLASPALAVGASAAATVALLRAKNRRNRAQD